ncbi:rna exonuclease 4 [Diplodia corticola]|uniref:RNA exonuclease 4 n=1 Tax=Diplodia corticola TaxID=236234 RepID=A0A1J9RJR8_9PEZI|nr:rna exonuclease 4 [Diplodia corticola]OJD40713.1 rna exonuclease 4 [Diplodia corticola]
MDLKALSSNWKKLQQTLQTTSSTKEKKDQKPILSRKNPKEASSKITKRAKPNTTASAKSKDFKKRKMGSLLSTAQEPSQPSTTPPSATLALFAEDHGIPVADVAAAYNLPTRSTTNLPTTTTNASDVPNGGLTATVTPGKYVALDCEMVGVGPTPDQDSQLARVSVVDYHGAQLYDSYVLPKLPVTDYRTAVSGITPALLRPGFARPFADVQRDVAALLEGRILVAHAVKNDLDALMLGHAKRDIRDTSRHPAFRKTSMGKAPALKKLAREFLGVEIQGGEHSSVEDARATMLLFRKEKDAFEAEHAKRWGRPEGGDSGGKKKKKGRK